MRYNEQFYPYSITGKETTQSATDTWQIFYERTRCRFGLIKILRLISICEYLNMLIFKIVYSRHLRVTDVQQEK